MKLKFVLIFLTSIIYASFAISQDFRAGIITGLSTSQISGDRSGGYLKAGITGGLFVNREFRGGFSGEFAITFVKKGSRRLTKIDGKIVDIEYKLNMSYIEIPVLIKYDGDKFGLTYEVGPTFGVLLSAEEYPLTGQGDFNKTEIGIMGGVSKIISDRFSFSLRATHSVLRVREHASSATFQLNRGQYNAGLLFNLKYHLN